MTSSYNPTTGHKRAIGVFSSRAEAEQALRQLQASGFNMDHVSIVTRDGDRSGSLAGAETTRVGNKADEGAGVGAVSGGALGGITGLLVGLGTLAIPGVGPIMLAGAAATAIATTLAGGAIGAASGGLLGGLIGLGVPEAEAKRYNDRVAQGDYLVVVDGTEAELRSAETILKGRGLRDWQVVAIPASAGAAPQPLPAATPDPITAVTLNKSTTDVAAPISTTPLTGTASSAVATEAESVKLYEERLIADKTREKTGEVAIGKRVETETASVSVPLERERVVVQRVPVSNTTQVDAIEGAFQEGEAIRMEVYEETPDIRKETFVREEVSIRKEVDHESAQAEEVLRREELTLNKQGQPVVEDSDQLRGDRL
ncbi:MAG TPA: DUF2382 domain-containing protein [Thermosynechococcaceae cyanobacterium]